MNVIPKPLGIKSNHSLIYFLKLKKENVCIY